MPQSLRIGIVGGSISGMCAAIVLSRLGHVVTVYERTTTRLEDRGAALGCEQRAVERWKDLDLIDPDLVGISPRNRVWCVKDGNSYLGRVLHEQPMAIQQLSWGNVYRQLLDRASTARFVRGVQIDNVVLLDQGARLEFEAHPSQDFDLVIGADGYMSTVRSCLFSSIETRFAGYVGWRGVVAESSGVDMNPVMESMQSVSTPQGNALFLMMPGVKGSVEPGHRGITFLWYEARTPTDILPITVSREGVPLISSIPPGQMSAGFRERLDTMADELLPSWHADIVHRSTDPFLQPIYDSRQDHYVRGRVCLLGDAASTARPHTGSGAAKGIEDAIALGQRLTEQDSVDAALAEYDTERVEAGDQVVKLGQAVGDDTVLNAPDWAASDPTTFAAWVEQGPQSRVYYHSHP